MPMTNHAKILPILRDMGISDRFFSGDANFIFFLPKVVSIFAQCSDFLSDAEY